VTYRDQPPPPPPIAQLPPPDLASLERSSPGLPALRAGQLTPLWSLIVAVGWGVVMATFIVLGAASTKIGKPTWWVGDAVDFAPTVTWFVPFLLPALALSAAATNIKGSLLISLIAAVGLGVVGGFDVGRSPGIATAELAVAGAALLMTFAATGGRLRAAGGRYG
jgi:hypothetical protein